MLECTAVTEPDETQVEVFRGIREHLALQPKLLELRKRIGADRNASTDPLWFALNSVDSRRRPVTAVMMRGGQIAGAVLLREQKRYGISLGYLFACDAAADEFILAEEGCKAECLRICVAALLKRFPSWIVSIAAREDYAPTLGPNLTYRTSKSTAKYRLTLLSSLDKTLQKFGSHTRRNMRYYPKKLSQSGTKFVGSLSDELARAVATELHPNVDYPITERLLDATIAAVSRTPGHFFAGLQASDGAWLTLIAGWRQGGSTRVLYQMNNRHFRKASLSLASRSLLIEHEIAQGASELAFVSYTTGSIENAFNEDTRYDILAAKPSWRLALLAWFAGRFLDKNHRLNNLATPSSGPALKHPPLKHLSPQ